MINRQYQELAERFSDVIVKLADNPQALDNLELYLSFHFWGWLKKYANTPLDLVIELERFASIEF